MLYGSRQHLVFEQPQPVGNLTVRNQAVAYFKGVCACGQQLQVPELVQDMTLDLRFPGRGVQDVRVVVKAGLDFLVEASVNQNLAASRHQVEVFLRSGGQVSFTSGSGNGHFKLSCVGIEA